MKQSPFIALKMALFEYKKCTKILVFNSKHNNQQEKYWNVKKPIYLFFMLSSSS